LSRSEPLDPCLTKSRTLQSVNSIIDTHLTLCAKAMPHRIKFVHWPLTSNKRYIWYSEEGTVRGRSPSRPLLAVPNVTSHQSTPGVPITVLLYNGLLLCGFNVPVKGRVNTNKNENGRRKRAMLSLLLSTC